MADGDDRLSQVVAAVADGAPIDWQTGSADPAVEQLRQVAQLRSRGAKDATHAERDTFRLATPLLRFIIVVAMIKVAAGLAGISMSPPVLAAYRSATVAHSLLLLVFGAASLGLMLGGRHDPRARALGAGYLMIATIGAHRHVEALMNLVPPGWAGVVRTAMQGAAVEPFFPVFLLLFAVRFPDVQRDTRPQRMLVWLGRASIPMAMLFLVLNILHVLPGLPPEVRAWTAAFDHTRPSARVQIDLLLIPATLVLVLWKATVAPPQERRRARLLVGGIAFGLMPVTILSALVSPWSPIADRFSTDAVRLLGVVVIYPTMYLMPITTAYAVLVEHVLDVRLLVGRALRYGLARSVVRAVSVAPMVAFAVLAWMDGDQTMVVIGQTPAGRILAIIAAIGAVMWLVRPRLLALVDRAFLREQHDARAVFAGFAEEARAALGVRDVAAITRRHVDAAFHVEDVAVLIADAPRGVMVAIAGRAPALPLDSGLCAMLAATPAPVVFARPDADPILPLLAPAERAWVSDTGVAVLAPLPASDGALLGVLALCARRAAIPYTEDDLLLITAVAAAAATTIEHRQLQEAGHAAPAPSEPPAAECGACGLVYPPDTAVCRCGTPLAGARAPVLLAGKFRCDRRLGAGAMGVVYAGVDVTLDRPVAIKALPRLSAPSAARLQSEARAMARVSHPNVATIFAIEWWRHTPLLIVERLDGGVLADRLGRGPIEVDDAVTIAVTLAGALARMHGAGLLHRDIKPANVGFTTDGDPKLIDFGLAVVRETTGGEEPWPAGAAGTPLYASPEVLAGGPVDAAADLWSLHLVLYECVAGVHPFRRPTPAQTVAAMERGVVPDVRTVRAGMPAPLADYLQRALARDAARRPSCADAVVAALSLVLSELTTNKWRRSQNP